MNVFVFRSIHVRPLSKWKTCLAIYPTPFESHAKNVYTRLSLCFSAVRSNSHQKKNVRREGEPVGTSRNTHNCFSYNIASNCWLTRFRACIYTTANLLHKIYPSPSYYLPTQQTWVQILQAMQSSVAACTT